MKIKFVIDKKYDFEMIHPMLQGKDWEYRAGEMGINLDFAKQIHKFKERDSPKIFEELWRLVEEEYSKVETFMEKTRQQYQDSWNEIMEDFSKIIAELTFPWLYDEYTCVVTNFHPGLSNWNGDVIGRWWKENPYTQRRITAHEILLAHYFSIHRHHFPDSGLTDKQIWALAEIDGFALTGLEDKLKQFWPWDNRGYYSDHNYPHIVQLQKELRDPFINRKDFKEYVGKGIKLVKNYPLDI